MDEVRRRGWLWATDASEPFHDFTKPSGAQHAFPLAQCAFPLARRVSVSGVARCDATDVAGSR
jgi:hypothetical protein